MGIGEQIDAATVTYLKQVRINQANPEEAWCEANALIAKAAESSTSPEAVAILAHTLLDLNKAIWDHDAPVRMMKVDFGDNAMLAKIGLLACDARDFNEFRTRVVDLINLLCGDERKRKVGMNQNRFSKEKQHGSIEG